MMQNQAKNSGMALVTVIVFSGLAMVVITAGVSLSILTSQANLGFLQGQKALYVAEAGAEEALIRLLRNPAFTEETLPIDGGTAIINVSDSAGIKVITVEGQVAWAKRRIVVEVDDSSGMMVVNSWQEQF